MKYLDQDADQADAVPNAVAQLQKKQVLERQVARTTLEVRKQLKQTKQPWKDALANQGRHFHGYTSRQRRTQADSTPETGPSFPPT